MVSSNSKYQQFLVTYCSRQNWTLPDSIIFYITKNPSTPNLYQKLIQTCKHFFIKNSIIVVEHLIFSRDDKIFVHFCDRRVYIDLKNFTNKIWLISSWNSFDTIAPLYMSSFIPKLYQCEVKHLCLRRQILTFDEFLFIALNVEEITLCQTTVKNNDDLHVPFEKLVRELSKIKGISFTNNEESASITPNTVKELLKISNFAKLEKFYLFGITEIFDIITFLNYIKKNKITRIWLSFDGISEAYKNQLENFVNEIIESENRVDFKYPFIDFSGIPREKYYKMKRLFNGK